MRSFDTLVLPKEAISPCPATSLVRQYRTDLLTRLKSSAYNSLRYTHWFNLQNTRKPVIFSGGD